MDLAPGKQAASRLWPDLLLQENWNMNFNLIYRNILRFKIIQNRHY